MDWTKTQIKGVIFDLDGTLIDSPIPFDTIREQLGIPEGDILKAVSQLPAPEREEAYRAIDELENTGMEQSTPVSGMRETLEYLNAHNIPYAIVTRGSRDRCRRLLEKHQVPVDVLVGREDAEPKPSPEAVLLASGKMGVPPEELLLVGDYVYDIEAGNRAGCRTVLLKRPWKKKFENRADVSIGRLDELITILQDCRE